MNADGIKNHVLEIEHFLNFNKIDILLNSESHPTLQILIKIPYYEICCANHRDGTAHAVSVIN
jgi:hypothetical protein